MTNRKAGHAAKHPEPVGAGPARHVLRQARQRLQGLLREAHRVDNVGVKAVRGGIGDNFRVEGAWVKVYFRAQGFAARHRPRCSPDAAAL